MKLDCDIAIIGSGAAGGVLASTLAEKTDKKIILLEKGGFYKGPTFVQEELGARHLFSDKGTRGCKDGSMPVRGGGKSSPGGPFRSRRYDPSCRTQQLADGARL